MQIVLDKQMDYAVLSGESISAPFELRWNELLGENYGLASSSILFNADSDISKVLSFLLLNKVSVADKVMVRNFLSNHSGIIYYLYELPQIVKKHFGDVGMKLEVFSEPDSSNSNQELFWEVETSFSPEDAGKKLSDLNRSWLLKIDDKDIYLFNISLKFP